MKNQTKKTVSMKENLDPNYRNDITKQSNSRESVIAEGRSERPVGRSEEIVEVAGQKFIRTPITSLRDDNPSLKAEHKAGFYRRWISVLTPGRLQQIVNLGFKQATTINGKLIPSVKRTTKNGKTEEMVLMEIPEEMRESFERANAQKAKNLADSVNENFIGQNLGVNNSQTYLVSDQQRIVNK